MGSTVRSGRISAFPTRRMYRQFLRESGQTVDDILFRMHMGMLSSRIRDQARADALRVLEYQAGMKALDRFVAEYHAKWRTRTVCAPEWRSQQGCGRVACVRTAADDGR